MTNVVVERVALDDGVPLLYKDGPKCVRLAYDPDQIAEPEALVRVALGLDRPLNGLTITRPDES